MEAGPPTPIPKTSDIVTHIEKLTADGNKQDRQAGANGAQWLPEYGSETKEDCEANVDVKRVLLKSDERNDHKFEGLNSGRLHSA